MCFTMFHTNYPIFPLVCLFWQFWQMCPMFLAWIKVKVCCCTALLEEGAKRERWGRQEWPKLALWRVYFAYSWCPDLVWLISTGQFLWEPRRTWKEHAMLCSPRLYYFAAWRFFLVDVQVSCSQTFNAHIDMHDAAALLNFRGPRISKLCELQNCAGRVWLTVAAESFFISTETA